MVSPAEKNGGGADSGLTVQSAPFGGAVTFMSTSAFAGAPASPSKVYYLSGRVPDSWGTAGIDPVQELPRGLLAQASVDSSPDLSKTLQASKLALTSGAIDGGSNVYLRDNATGALTLVAAAPGNELFQEFVLASGAPFAGGTPDWSHIVLRSYQALVPGAVEGVQNVYDFTAGHLKLVAAEAGVGWGESSLVPAPHPISADGSRVFFVSGNSIDGPLYMRENDGMPVPISVSQREGDGPTPRSVTFVSASADGSFVFFVSAENLTDTSETHGRPTLYRYEVDSGKLTDLTVNPNPASTVGAFVRTVLDVSEDGSYVYFSATGALAPGATELSPADGARNLYAWHDGTIRFIAQTGENPDQPEIHGAFKWLASPGGGYLGLLTFSPLTSEDVPSPRCPATAVEHNLPEECLDVYLYDYGDETLRCVSCNGPGAGFSMLGGQYPSVNANTYRARAVLDNGTIYFDTPNALVRRDGNGKKDVYSWRDGKVQLISTGSGDGGATFGDATPDGSDVYFLTEQQLVPADDDAAMDLYDARVGGGLTAQHVVPAGGSCSGEACRGESGAPPTQSFAGSSFVSGPGNAEPRKAPTAKKKRRCGRHRVRGTAGARRAAHRSKSKTKKANNCGGRAR